MRLIDADKLKATKGMFIYQTEDADVIAMEAYRWELIERETPTVEAIPIEWIENKIAVNVHLWEEGKDKMFLEDGVAKIVSYSLTAQALSQLLEWWEKENDKE